MRALGSHVRRLLIVIEVHRSGLSPPAGARGGGAASDIGEPSFVPSDSCPKKAAVSSATLPCFPGLQAAADASERLATRGSGQPRALGAEAVRPPRRESTAPHAEEHLCRALRLRQDVSPADNGFSGE